MTLLSAVALSLLLPLTAASAAGDPAKGKTLFLQCVACHATTATAPKKVGPSLFGIAGRKVGTAPGFAYSESMKTAGFNWTDEKLSAFLEKPSKDIPGNKMVFGGIADPVRRADLIAYLQTLK